MLFRDLDAVLSTPVLRDPAALEPFTRDFGRQQRVEPLGVARTTSEPELRRTLAFVHAAGIPHVMRGAGHSSNGQTLIDRGLVVRNFELSADVRFDPATALADVAARSSWLHVQRALNEQGRACPVLTDYLLLSVGGTLSVGGYGARSVAHGAQIDNVERLRVLLSDGVAVDCSRTEKPELFRRALAGQGAAGAIERALIRTIPHQRRARFYGFEHLDIHELAASLAWLEDWSGPAVDLFVGAQRLSPRAFTVSQYGFDLAPQRPLDAFMLTPLAMRTPSWVEVFENHDLMAHERTVDLVEQHPSCVRIWADYLFGYQSFLEFTRRVSQKLEEPAFRAHLSVLGVLIHRTPADAFEVPHAPSLPGLGRVKYMLGFYYFVPEDDAAEIVRVRAILRELLRECLALGGRPYRYGFDPGVSE